MLDPVIFSIELFGITLSLRWYGVLVMVGLVVGAMIAEREIDRRGGDAETLWDLLLWVVPAGVVGARAWYVLNDIFGGGQYFVQNPGKVIAITEGGLHIYGALVAGLAVAYIYLKRRDMDFTLFLDAVAPGLLVGQAVGRFANFINQELYGQPTDLPWGIHIAPEHRLPPWNNLQLYPEDTRFHPTFAYQVLWNLLGAGLLLWLGRRFQKQLRPGVIFAGWLIWAGVGRFWLEAFRPDQPRIPGTGISYTRVVAGLMALAGLLYVLVKYRKVTIPGISAGADSYS